ncbi:Tetratricopeptide-like helical domain-containing protein [Rozella allomycis CSF55]|uniref:Tetratricopeptide-like helical domain-containing protein n=1 Tax=Rozella allomycis (strain CSF55) TaxID=988480 RepID=A0A075B4I2_ROZAC|nr:Tetratricopeptide-like helical domain-containing protein [Rozella allomycis CSF55]|eukprot:EPZ36182.1 Tetratricopeptide-like helical domain-containing protein [Rozella allomycis CSF55]
MTKNYTPKNPEYYESLNKIPLFMDKMPENIEDNEVLLAIQSLLYDGTPEDVASNFKRSGNEEFQLGRYASAAEFYSKAILQKCDKEDLNATLYANRAACNLKLENYRQCLSDCAQALKRKPNHLKTLFRSAVASLALDRLEEAKDSCSIGLSIDSSAKEFSELLKSISARQSILDKKITEHHKKMEDADIQEKKLFELLTKRRYALANDQDIRPSPIPVADYQNIPKPIPDDDYIKWPVFLLYPAFGQADFIEGFHELDCFQDHLNLILAEPAPWDPNFENRVDNVNIYFEAWSDSKMTKKKLFKVAPNTTLLEVLHHPMLTIYNGILSFLVVSKNSQSEFEGTYLKN